MVWALHPHSAPKAEEPGEACRTLGFCWLSGEEAPGASSMSGACATRERARRLLLACANARGVHGGLGP